MENIKIKASVADKSKEVGTAVQVISETLSMLAVDMKADIEFFNKENQKASGTYMESSTKREGEQAKLAANADYQNKQAELKVLEAKNLESPQVLKLKKEALEKGEDKARKASIDVIDKAEAAERKLDAEEQKLNKMKNSLEELKNQPAGDEEKEKSRKWNSDLLAKDIEKAEEASKKAKKEKDDTAEERSKMWASRDDRENELHKVSVQYADAQKLVAVKSEIKEIEKPLETAKKECENASKIMATSSYAVQEMQEILDLSSKLSTTTFTEALKEGDAEAYTQLKELMGKYTVWSPEKFIDSVYEQRDKSRDAAKEFGSAGSVADRIRGSGGSEANKLKELAYEIKQYGSKTRRKTSTVGNDLAYGIGQELGMKSIDEQLGKVKRMLKSLDLEKLAEEVKTTEREYAKAAILDATATEINKAKEIGKIKISAASNGRAYLEKLTEEDVAKIGLSKELELGMKQAQEKQAEQQVQATTKDAVVSAMVTNETEKEVLAMYQKRAEKLSGLIEKLASKDDEQTINQINSGMIAMFKEVERLTQKYKFSEEAVSNFIALENALNKKVADKVTPMQGLTVVQKPVSEKHSKLIDVHLEGLMQKTEEEIEKHITSTYEVLCNIIADEYGIPKHAFEETVAEYLKRQKDLRDALRNLGPGKKAVLPQANVITKEKTAQMPPPAQVALQTTQQATAQTLQQPQVVVTNEEKTITGSNNMQELVDNLAKVREIKGQNDSYAPEEAIARVIFYATHNQPSSVTYGILLKAGGDHALVNELEGVKLPASVDAQKVLSEIGKLEVLLENKLIIATSDMITRTYGLRETAERVKAL